MTLLEEPIRQPLELRNFVDGEWVEPNGKMQDIVNPATGNVIATMRHSTADDMNRAVAAAKEAFSDWRRTPPLARARCLFRLKGLLEENFEELSRIQTMEHGKTIDESRGETRRGIENVEVATGIPTLMQGRVLEDIATGIDEYLIRQPLGVFGIITPFNFPFMIGLWFAPYAVATGNCVIIKPSPEDPICQTKIVELADEAGIPPGVWNVVHGATEAGAALLDHSDVEGICFVGSTPVGRDIVYRRCGETGKRVIAQCGAKNFLLVMPDADIDRTIAACMTSFYGNTGQRCLASANLVMVGEGLSKSEHQAFYRDVVDRFITAADRIRIGYGLDDSIHMGPIRDEKKKNNVMRYIEKGLEEGAELVRDGRHFEITGDYPDTCFIGPSVFEDVTLDMAIAREEIFGPVAMMLKAKSLSEAIDMIHGNPYGNAASIFTSNGKWARDFQYNVMCGNIGINVGIAAPMAFFPFSGMKDSFFGTLHGQSEEAVRFFTESKVVVQRWF